MSGTARVCLGCTKQSYMQHAYLFKQACSLISFSPCSHRLHQSATVCVQSVYAKGPQGPQHPSQRATDQPQSARVHDQSEELLPRTLRFATRSVRRVPTLDTGSLKGRAPLASRGSEVEVDLLFAPGSPSPKPMNIANDATFDLKSRA